MAFKNQKLSHVTGNVPVSLPSYQTVESSNGKFVEVVYSDGSDVNIPSPSDYKLEELLKAGVPLEKVDPSVINSVPSDIEGTINKIISSDSSKSDDSNVSND